MKWSLMMYVPHVVGMTVQWVMGTFVHGLGNAHEGQFVETRSPAWSEMSSKARAHE